MKKLIIAAAAAAALAAPALAATVTVEFAGADGETEVWTFDDVTMKATSADGVTVDYAYDDDTRTLSATLPEEGDISIVFEEAASEVGASSGYTVSNGDTGTATITAMAE